MVPLIELRGAMVYAVLDCIFQLGNGGKALEKYAFSLCFSIGFILMMSLDVLLG
jgi:zinc transporter ZupT